MSSASSRRLLVRASMNRPARGPLWNGERLRGGAAGRRTPATRRRPLRPIGLPAPGWGYGLKQSLWQGHSPVATASDRWGRQADPLVVVLPVPGVHGQPCPVASHRSRSAQPLRRLRRAATLALRRLRSGLRFPIRAPASRSRAAMPLELPPIFDLRGPERRDGGRAVLRRTMRAAHHEIVGAHRESMATTRRMVHHAPDPPRSGVLLACRDQPESPRARHRRNPLVDNGVPRGSLSGLTWGDMPANIRIPSVVGIVACAGTALLMLGVDVPMYVARWRHGRRSGVRHLRMVEGLKDVLQRRQVARRWSEWRPEVPWMSLYFSAGVWVSFWLVFV